MPALYRDMPCGTRRGTGWLERAAETRRGREHAGRARVDERQGGTGRGRGPLEGNYGFLCAAVCVRVRVRRECRDGLRARASTYEGTESRRVSSIDEDREGRGGER